MTAAVGFLMHSFSGHAVPARLSRAVATAAALLLTAPLAMAQLSLGTVNPLNGSGMPGTIQNLTFTATYPASPGTLPVLNVSMNTTWSQTSACFFNYRQFPSSGVPTLYLYDDNIVNSYPVRLGTSDTASNSQCQITGANSSSTYSSGALSLSVGVTFANAWAGSTLNFYEIASDASSGSNTGWWQMPGASFQVEGASAGPPQLGTFSAWPLSSPPNQQNFLSFSASDPGGWQAITEIAVLVSSNHQPANACYMAYFPQQYIVYLFSDDLSLWSPAYVNQRSPVASNSHCSLYGGSTTTQNSTTVQPSLTLEFSPLFVGANYFDEFVADQYGGTVGLATIPGTFTVTGPPLITTNPFLNFGLTSTAYTTTFTEQGGVAPFRWSIQSGSLPPGISLSTAGVLSGTPVLSGSYNFTIGLTDSTGASATPLSCNLAIIDPSATETQSGGVTDPITQSAAKVGAFRNQITFMEDTDGDPYNGEERADNFTPPDGIHTGDLPVVGDWTGDGNAKAGFYRPSTGQWFLDWNNNGVWDSGDVTYSFGGIAGDLPFVGNWANQQGVAGHYKDCVGIFRYGAYWMLDLNCNGTFDGMPPGPDNFFGFGGLAGDVPVVGAWTGGKTRVGIVRKYVPPGTNTPIGNPFYWVPSGSDADVANTTPQPDYVRCFAYGGVAGDIFLTGDWYNTGISTAAIYRRENDSRMHFLLDAAIPGKPQPQHLPALDFYLSDGQLTDVPLVGKWTPTSAGRTPEPLSFSFPTSTTNTDSSTYTQMYSDDSGDATNLAVVQLAFAIQSLNPMYYSNTLNGCGVQYYPPAGNTNPALVGNGTLYLLSADGTNQPLDSSAIGPTGQTLINGVCQVDAANTTYTVDGAVATLNVPVTFINPAATSYTVWASATNSQGVFDNWVADGTWSAPAVPLISSSLTVNGGPLGGTGNVATFTAVFTDTAAAGVGDMNDVNIMFSTQNTGVLNSAGPNASNVICDLFYAVQTRTLSLGVAGGSGYVGSSRIGAGGTMLSNGFCEVNAAQFTAVPSNNSLSVSVPITFTPSGTVQYFAYTSLTANPVAPINNGWTKFGIWTVSPDDTTPVLGPLSPQPPPGPAPGPAPPPDVSSSVTDCNDISGTWTDAGADVYTLHQTGSSVSGTIFQPDNLCSSGIIWTVSPGEKVRPPLEPLRTHSGV